MSFWKKIFSIGTKIKELVPEERKKEAEDLFVNTVTDTANNAAKEVTKKMNAG